MGQFERSRNHDSRYRERSREYDRPPATDVTASIREMRKIYKEYSDADFSAWYSTRYGIRMAAVLAVIKADREKGSR